MKVDLDRLERFAVSATPGPWKATSQKLRPQLPLRIMEVVAAPGEPPIIPWKGFDTCDRPKTERLANSSFIAAANPAVVLELVRRLREADDRVLMAVEAEREACARLCESEWSTEDERRTGQMFAREIRARNQPQKGRER
jgi:hypothetical protein